MKRSHFYWGSCSAQCNCHCSLRSSGRDAADWRSFDAGHFLCNGLTRTHAGIAFSCDGLIVQAATIALHEVYGIAREVTSGKGFRRAADLGRPFWPISRTGTTAPHSNYAGGRIRCAGARGDRAMLRRSWRSDAVGVEGDWSTVLLHDVGCQDLALKKQQSACLAALKNWVVSGFLGWTCLFRWLEKGDPFRSRTAHSFQTERQHKYQGGFRFPKMMFPTKGVNRTVFCRESFRV